MRIVRVKADFPRTGFVLAVLVVSSVVAMRWARGVTGDLDFFVGIARQLTTGRGALVYADNPNTQSGPLSLLAVRAIDAVGLAAFPVVICLLGIVTLVVLSRTQTSVDGHDLRLLVGGLLLTWWWPYLKTAGHLDDALTLTLATVCLLLVLRGRFIPAGVVVGVMLAVKPWTVFLLPMVMANDERGWRRFTPAATAIVVGAVLWSPFLVASTETLDGLRPTVRLAPDSVLRLVGADPADFGSVLRYLQLGLAVAAAAVVAVWRRRPAGVLLAGVAVRIALDPGTWNYYTVGFVLGALMWDLSRPSRLPLVTLGACLLLPPTWAIESADLRAIMRLVACLCALAIVMWPDELDQPSEDHSSEAGSVLHPRSGTHEPA